MCWSNNGGNSVYWPPTSARSICRKREGNVCKKGGSAKEGMTIGNDFYNKDNILLNGGLKEDNNDDNYNNI